MKKVAIVVVVLITLVVAVVGGLSAYYSPQEKPPVYGSISVSEQLQDDRDYRFGEFQAAWKGEKAKLLVTHQAFEGQSIFATPAGEAFLTAAHGVKESEEFRGFFDIEEERKVIYDQQVVEDIREEDNTLIIEGALGNEEEKEAPYQFKLSAVEEKQLQYEVNYEEPSINRSYLSWATDEEEHFFGFGAQFSTFNMDGRRLPIIVQEQGIGRGDQPLTFLADVTNQAGGTWFHTYAPIPHFISSEMRSMFSENKEYQVFHFTEDSKAQLEVFSEKPLGRIYAGENPAELLEEHTSVVGRMRPLPEWTQEGLVLGAQGGTEEVLDKLEALLEQDVPVTGLWIQDWVGQRKTSFGKQLWWNWELDKEHYPNWEEFTGKLEEEDVKLLGYVNPFLVDTSEKDNVRRDQYQEAKEKGYFVKDDEGEPKKLMLTDFTGGLLDLTIPEAREWIKDIIKEEMVERGFHGWMADFGEALPHEVEMDSGESGSTYHNRYPEEWAKINLEILEEEEMLEEGMFFVRAGFSESPRYASTFWLGDQNVTWDEHDGIKTAVTGLLTSGLSGISYNHSDIGGYTSITDFPLNIVRSEELLKRWIELNAFTSMYRSHEGNQPDENLQIYSQDNIIQHVAEFARIFRDLAPYRRELMEEAAETGAPIVRPLFFHYPNDPETYDIDYRQFMLGEDMIIAPVLDEGKEEVSAYLPEGEWVHYWSGETYQFEEGEDVEVSAPIGEPGIFYRPGSMVEDLLK